ncbi:unnamed protein product [Pedinophyceae sp. YPF-701]|nr:unnamed protein product [Pedinophyceae sp. YPF-701]
MAQLRSDFVDTVVGPGEPVAKLPERGTVRIGTGLRSEGGHLECTKAGVLRLTKQGRLWVEGNQKRYIPQTDDLVIGVVRSRLAESFVVDIRAPSPAQLPALAFEGATKRNRPNLQPGDLVYARVAQATPDMDAELSCVDAVGRAAGFGPLKGGVLTTCPTGTARRLLVRPPSPVLTTLGKFVQYEVAVGMNGRVWVSAATPAAAALVVAAVKAVDGRSDADAVAAVTKLAGAL